MSVIMTVEVKGNPEQLEQYSASNRDEMNSIAEKAKGHGLIAHRFYGSQDGRIIVIDEWPDQESFDAFFQESQEGIQGLMQAAGAQSQPEITCWRKLDTHDEVGWES
jgi:quinol monooxygenase YgiN